MPDYKEMYLNLFRAQTRAITILQEAQQLTEEIYIQSEPADIRLITDIAEADNKTGDELPVEE